MRWIAGAAAGLLLLASSARTEDSRLADASADRIHASIPVPEPSRKVGEVHLITRGDATVVQTLLSTKLLSRVTAEIRKKEEGNWPAGQPDTKSYLEALDAARARLEKQGARADLGDRRQRLMIEFVASSTQAAVIVGTFTVSAGADFTPVSREVFQTLTPSRDYVLRNMRLILADSFKVPEGEVDKLGPLGPASTSKQASDAALSKDAQKPAEKPVSPSRAAD